MVGQNFSYLCTLVSTNHTDDCGYAGATEEFQMISASVFQKMVMLRAEYQSEKLCNSFFTTVWKVGIELPIHILEFTCTL